VWLTNVCGAPGGTVNVSGADDVPRAAEPDGDGAALHLEALLLVEVAVERAGAAAGGDPGLADQLVGVVGGHEAPAEAERVDGGLVDRGRGLGECGGGVHAAFARFEHELIEATPAFGGRKLRATHNHVLRHLDEGGTRASVIAERAGLTRQAITQIVDELEQAGVVTREPDPDDGRAKRVVYTTKGRKAFGESRARIEAIERRWREQLGPARYEELVAALRDIGTER
jgi:DNA-binding MarR family transcriptional regulator